jgi:glycosyltransferase involved in cell wall biosynthesis
VRIGIMLRHYDQHAGGVRIYTREMLDRLFALGSRHRFVLLYQNPALIGTYRHVPEVEEVVLRMPGAIAWDQLAVPWLARRHRLDVLFNPKFSLPFLARIPKAFVLHGSEWFAIPKTFPWYDRLYTRLLVPRYCRSATRFITVADQVKRDAIAFTGVDAERAVTIYNGFDRERFRRITDADALAEVRARHHLPERFILWVGQIYPPKNFGRLVRAFAKLAGEFEHTLVIAGEPRRDASGDLALVRELGLGDRVRFTGWLSHDDLPALYNLAELFVLPSLYEGFGIPLLEAMACGCPVVTSRTGSPPEIVAGGALLVDPLDPDDIANAMARALRDPELRAALVQRGLERAAEFSWERCARAVLTMLESFAPAPQPALDAAELTQAHGQATG